MKTCRWVAILCLVFLVLIFSRSAALALPISEVEANLSVTYTLTAAPENESFNLRLDSFETYAWGSLETPYLYQEIEDTSEIKLEDETTGSKIEVRNPSNFNPLSSYTYAVAGSDKKGKVNATAVSRSSASFTALGAGTVDFEVLFDAIVRIASAGSSAAVNGESSYEVTFSIDGKGPTALGGGTGLIDAASDGEGDHTFSEKGGFKVDLVDGQRIVVEISSRTNADPEPIPEPLTAALVGAGLMALTALALRRGRSAG
jgi:hypothetical protein